LFFLLCTDFFCSRFDNGAPIFLLFLPLPEPLTDAHLPPSRNQIPSVLWSVQAGCIGPDELPQFEPWGSCLSPISQILLPCWPLCTGGRWQIFLSTCWQRSEWRASFSFSWQFPLQRNFVFFFPLVVLESVFFWQMAPSLRGNPRSPIATHSLIFYPTALRIPRNLFHFGTHPSLNRFGVHRTRSLPDGGRSPSSPRSVSGLSLLCCLPLCVPDFRPNGSPLFTFLSVEATTPNSWRRG